MAVKPEPLGTEEALMLPQHSIPGTWSIPELEKVQQNACEVFIEIPQRKPSPPERDTMAGRELAYGDANEDDLLLFFCQHVTSCLPPASMAQKKPLSPNVAAIGPDEPYPKAAIAIADSSKRRGREYTQEKTMCYGGRGWPGIQSAVIVNRPEVVLTPERGRAAAKLDLEDERTEGQTAAMPQLVKALEAILKRINSSRIRDIVDEMK
ncbi:hypothetical protein RJ639_033645 [Escallonia herrerae]|uniref:Uncharacterized protein n=1 Tax=Escallonia herrerae TaxID=1293975 RepID=A0AA88WW87_9ASTE|nr:hypothetical protein RJ639_033645 [Escallonia herrerae]